MQHLDLAAWLVLNVYTFLIQENCILSYNSHFL